ncbi:MAG: anthranilate synthase component I family protein [Planctomycetota bacterium]
MSRPIHTTDDALSERRRRLRAVVPSDGTTPLRALAALRAEGRRAALLESADGPESVARYSFVVADPRASLVLDPAGGTLAIDGRSERLDGPPLGVLRAAHERTAGPPRTADEPPLAGGFVGFLSHELVAQIEPTVTRPEADPIGAPLGAFERFATVLCFDHARHRLHVSVELAGETPTLARARKRLEERLDTVHGAVELPGEFQLEGPVQDAFGTERFVAGVETLQAAIRAGECFQAVLARRFSAPCSGDPLALYRALRLSNAAPHMFFFEAAGVSLVGSSPERLLSVERGVARLTPIAGTRPRGADAAEDEALAEELAGDRKERAEHHMLVDLARNDLGRVARYGGVRVERLMTLERFARVQHLTSSVAGTLAPGRDALDALSAVFPAGTVSGAPKIRALQLVTELEGEQRGPYAGAFGYLGDDGGLDLALVLRTAVVARDAVHVQAGAGVVHRSDPEAEERETRAKAQGVLEGIELADSGLLRPITRPLAEAIR